VLGRRYDAELGCFEDTEVAGTTEASDVCDDAIGIALDPALDCWWFPNTCLPDGFTAEVPDDSPCRNAELCDVNTLCGSRSLDECTDDARCMVANGGEYDAAGECFLDYAPQGCVDATVACPPNITLALDADGRCVSFGGCLPLGFTAAPPEHPCSEASPAGCVQ
jgi:hypothetical protein